MNPPSHVYKHLAHMAEAYGLLRLQIQYWPYTKEGKSS